MSNLVKDEAIVLRKSLAGDFDVSVTVYMRKYGKENIYISKGQLLKSPFISLSEPFTWLKGIFVRKKEKFFIKEIDRFRAVGIDISKDIERFQTAHFVFSTFNQQVIYPEEKLFVFLKKTLYYLTQDVDFSLFRLNFLAKLIYLSGIYPELYHCIRCGSGITAKNYRFLSINEGGTVCKRCSKQKGNLSYMQINELKKLKIVSFKDLNRLKIKNPSYLEMVFTEYLRRNL